MGVYTVVHMALLHVGLLLLDGCWPGCLTVCRGQGATETESQLERHMGEFG